MGYTLDAIKTETLTAIQTWALTAFAEALAVGQLGEGQTQDLVEARAAADLVLALVAGNAGAELRQRGRHSMICAKTVRPLFMGHSFRKGLAPVYREIEIEFAQTTTNRLQVQQLQ
jgi:hypothetical protein